MTQYPDTEPEDGYYEVHLGFFWKPTDKPDTPQSVTIDFQLTEEMEEDYPGEDENEEYGFEKAEQMREDWAQHHLATLLERGFVTDAYSHEDISSVTDLKTKLNKMNFNAYYA